MAQHYSFISDATDCFLDAFAIYETETTKSPDKQTLAPLATCCRHLYVALEKGFKHSLAEIDPHLLLTKPDRQSLLEIQRDLIDRPVPTMFCSRSPFDTVGLALAWDALRSLAPKDLDKQVVSDFDRALGRLILMRHKVQHGEWFEEPDEVLAVVREVLARFRPIANSLAPDFIEALVAENGQLLSRLRAIEKDVDANWQVLVDYLRAQGDIHMEIDFFVKLTDEGENLQVLFGRNGASAIFGQGDIPLSMADGFFATSLTKAQTFDRYSERQRRLAESDPADLVGLPEGVEGLAPLDTGHLAVPSTTAWLSLRLNSVVPSRLYTSAIMSRLAVSFDDPDSTRGLVSGELDCAVFRPGTQTETIRINGEAFFDSEHYQEAGDSQEGEARVRLGLTRRLVVLVLTLSLGSANDVTA